MLQKAPMRPNTEPIMLWWIWQNNPNVPLEGYCLGLAKRPREGEGEDVAITVYDPENNIVWLGFLKGSLWRVNWQSLFGKWVQITYRQQGNQRGFEVLYDPERILSADQKPQVKFVGKFLGFELNDIPF